MSNPKKCSPTSTSSTNVTIDQMIEHMTADLQGSSDGQYIQLGFTPPTTNDTTWTNFHEHHHHRMNYAPSYPPGFNNFIPSNQHFTNPGYILYNQSTTQDIQPPVPPGGVVINRDFNGGMFEQQFSPPPTSYNLYQQQNSKQTFTSSGHLIENLVGNWTPNTSGTYSPFGGGGPIIHNHQETTAVKQPPIVEINVQNDVSNVKKPRMVAEVKPMRLRYSDVLAKSVPPTATAKATKVDVKENLTKKQPQNKKTTPSKTSTLKLQNRNDIPKPKSSSTSPTICTSSIHNTTSSAIQDDLSDVEFINRQPKSDRIRSNKNTESSTTPSTSSNTSSSTSHPRSSQKLTFEYRGDDSNNVRNNEKTFMAKSKKAKDFKKFGNSSYGVSDKSSTSIPGGRRGGGHGRGGRRRGESNHTNTTLGQLQRSIKQYLQRWSTLMFYVIVWLLHLISDVCSLSIHLANDVCTNSWTVLKEQASIVSKTTVILFSKIQIFAKICKYVDDHVGNKWFAFWNRGKNKDRKNNSDSSKTSWNTSAGLDANITMPSTGEEAMKRLLACKGKDPYSILGVTPDCTDDDIKRYYKRQAFLVHPDKNQQPGAEEAFKILVHAFDIIGETERRQSYDRKVIESHQVEQAWSELNDLLSQLQQKMEYAANTIRCTNCTKRHRRIHVDRPSYAARACAQCKIHHSVKEGDIWAESQCFGFLWYYYACMDGAIYDITEWASCQRSNLRHLRPNTHQVQYRIVLGKQQQHHHHTQSSSSSFNSTATGGFHHTASPGGVNHNHQYNSSSSGSHHHHRSGPKLDREPDLEDLEEFLNNLYQKTGGASHGNPTGTNPEGSGTPSSSTCTSDHLSSGASGNNRQQDTTRNRKKNKRKK